MKEIKTYIKKLLYFFAAITISLFIENIVGIKYNIIYDEFNFKLIAIKLLIFIIGFIIVDFVLYLLKKIKCK